jgi:hypothetical protein
MELQKRDAVGRADFPATDFRQEHLQRSPLIKDAGDAGFSGCRESGPRMNRYRPDHHSSFSVAAEIAGHKFVQPFPRQKILPQRKLWADPLESYCCQNVTQIRHQNGQGCPSRIRDPGQALEFAFSSCRLAFGDGWRLHSAGFGVSRGRETRSQEVL